MTLESAFGLVVSLETGCFRFACSRVVEAVLFVTSPSTFVVGLDVAGFVAALVVVTAVDSAVGALRTSQKTVSREG